MGVFEHPEHRRIDATGTETGGDCFVSAFTLSVASGSLDKEDQTKRFRLKE